jgi:hypothetical protein
MPRDLKRVVHRLHAKTTQCRFQLGVPEQELNRSQILRLPIDHAFDRRKEWVP